MDLDVTQFQRAGWQGGKTTADSYKSSFQFRGLFHLPNPIVFDLTGYLLSLSAATNLFYVL